MCDFLFLFIQHMTTNGDICCICLESLEASDNLMGLSCEHMLHFDCGLKILKTKSCPLCRAKIHVEDVIRSLTKRVTSDELHCKNIPRDPNPSLQIFLKTFSGGHIGGTHLVSPTDLIGHLILQISKDRNIPFREILVIYRTQSCPPRASFKDLGITSCSTLFVARKI
jgi:hypothetical protein